MEIEGNVRPVGSEAAEFFNRTLGDSSWKVKDIF
jgi:hypothetical protein